MVVTYNRKDLLLECITCLLGQTTAPLFDILVIDNASDDGTAEALADLSSRGILSYVNTGSNLGGAGGFQMGIRMAVEAGYGRVWLMDDDCMPEPNALEELLVWDEVLGGDYGFLSSKALWSDGSVCKMNVQRETLTRNVSDFDQNPIRVEMASFVSLLVRSEAVLELGLPIKEFFIWTDDWEFTRRISRHFSCYLVTSSVVVHESADNNGANIATDGVERLGRYRYLYRNDVFLYRREGFRGFAYEAVRLTGHAARILFARSDNKRQRMEIVASGTREGFRFHPLVERCFEDPNEVRVLELFGEPIASGGQESFVRATIEHMDRSGLHIDWCTAYHVENEGHREAVRGWGGEVYELGAPFMPGKSRRVVETPLREFFFSHGYDVVHVHSGSATFLSIASRVAKQAGAKKVLVHSHCSVEHLGPRQKAIRGYASIGVRKYADEFLACSRLAAEAKFAPDISARAMIVKNGIDIEKFQYDPQMRGVMRSRLGIVDGALVVGHVGRYSHQKNHEFLLNVFESLVAECEESILLLLGDGVSRDNIATLVSDASVMERVICVGAVPNVNEYLQAMDVFVFPSRFEGLGIAVVEAQAAGLPVVLSDCCSREADLTGECEFLSLHDPVDGWKEAVLDRAGAERGLQGEAIRRAGFDARYVARGIRRLYCIDALKSSR